MSIPTSTTTKQLINSAIDTARLATVYHDQAAALFNAIEALHGDPKHKDTITQLCAIGWLLSDEAGNAKALERDLITLATIVQPSPSKKEVYHA